MPTNDNDNTGRMMTKRTRGKQAILALTFNEHEAERLRQRARTIRIKGDKHPSMSLLARYGLRLLEAAIEKNPDWVMGQLEQMVTEVPKPVGWNRSSRKAAQPASPAPGSLELMIPAGEA